MSGRKVDKIGQYSQEQGGNWAFDDDLAGKVHIAAISSDVELQVYFDSEIDYAVTILSNTVASSATQTVVGAMVDKGIEIHGVVIGNGSTNMRNVELRFGTERFFRAPFAANGGSMNLNYISNTPFGPANEPVILWMDNAGTVTVTLNYKAKDAVAGKPLRGWGRFTRFGPRR